jgi:hypothetical protein
MFKNFLKDNNATIEEIKLIIDGLGSSSSEGLTIEDVDAGNPYVGISKVHELTEGTDLQNSTYVESNKTSFFQYYRTTSVSGDLLNLGMFVAGYNPSFTPGIMFLIDKRSGIIKIGKTNNGSTELFGSLTITNADQSTEFRCFDNRVRFTKKGSVDAKDTVNIPYGINFTDLETRLSALENGGFSSGLTIEDVDAANPYVGISRLHTLPFNYSTLPAEKDETTFFEYYKEVGNSGGTGISRFGMFVRAKESVNTGNLFVMDKST